MIPPIDSKKKIVFLFSDTGGGHRSSTEAIMEALEIEYPDQFQMKMVDIFREYAPTPFHQAPEFYPQMTKNQRVWKAGYQISNGKRKADLFTQIMWPYVRQAINRLVNENHCDLFVSVHPFAIRGLLNVTTSYKIPLVTVVTDMVSVHAFWFDPRADLVIVPTETARRQGIRHGVPPAKIVVAGQPVADKFCHPREDRMNIRKQLGWNPEKPVILLVGGGQGLGPLEKIALAIDEAGLPAELVIVAGRNQRLLENLRQRSWKTTTHIYGFVKEMPDFMAAADILVTKAGPGTISEAFIVGLPLILNSRLPGQEDGNVSYVLENQAGVWAPEPAAVVSTLKNWIHYPEKLKMASDASRKLGTPEATREIARLIAHQLFMPAQNQPLLLPKPG